MTVKSKFNFTGAILTAAGLLLFSDSVLCAANKGKDVPPWVTAMRKVHAKFSGRKGTFAHFGDSITITMAFWAPLRWGRINMSDEAKRAFALVNRYMIPECWRGWKGPKYGNNGGMTIRWAYKNVDQWLKRLNPEVVLIMFGTNDLTCGVTPQEYEEKTRAVVRKCLDNGTIVILSTIPPRHGLFEKAEQFAGIVRKIAKEMKVALCDYFAEIVKRRPDDWDGKLDKFKAYKGYNVPTLIARGGVHPSNPRKYANDYSEEGLRHNGYTLRTYLTLMAYARVVENVLQNKNGTHHKER